MSCYPDWDGQELGDGPLAIMLFGVQNARNSLPVVCMATAASGDDQAGIRVERLAVFLRQHADRVLICANAGTFHWTLTNEFERAGEGTSLRDLWQTSRENRLVDLLVLDQLVDLGEANQWYHDGSLSEVIRRRIQIDIPDIEVLGRQLLESSVSGFDRIDQEVFQHAITVARTMLAAYQLLDERAGAIAQENRVPDRTIGRFGLLSSGLKVRGAIALHPAARSTLLIDPKNRQSAKRTLAGGRDAHLATLVSNRDARQCFKTRNGRIHVENGLPGIKTKRLRQWLAQRSHERFVDRDMPALIPHHDKRACTVPSAWGILRDCDSLLHAWSESLALSRSIKILDRTDANILELEYSTIPRIESNPDPRVLHHLRRRELLRPEDGHVLITVNFEELDVRALAETIERRSNCSQLADIYRDDGSACKTLAESFSNFVDSTADASRLSVGDLADNWRRIAEALLQAIGLKLSVELVRQIIQIRFGINISVTEARRLYERVIDFCPGLRAYIADDTIERLSGNLEVGQAECRERLLETYSEVDVRQALAGYRRPPIFDFCINEIRKLNRNRKLQPLLDRCVGRFELYKAALGSNVVTASGRVRAHCLFSEETAEHLEMADDAVMAALHAVSADGHRLAGCARDDFTVQTAENDEPARVAHRIAEVAARAARNVVDGIPVVCRCQIREAW